jgi:hypothetical protein
LFKLSRCASSNAGHAHFAAFTLRRFRPSCQTTCSTRDSA